MPEEFLARTIGAIAMFLISVGLLYVLIKVGKFIEKLPEMFK
ncbi:MAG: hypothetical protein ACE5HW_06095 [Candidatus Methanofastidiosia archaeon]